MDQSALGSQLAFTGKQELMTTAPALKAFHRLKVFTIDDESHGGNVGENLIQTVHNKQIS